MMRAQHRKQSTRRNEKQKLLKKLDQIEAESRRRGVPAMMVIRIVNGEYQVFEAVPRGVIDLPLE